MEYPITISTLNDFIFCPYSIYLHNVYDGADNATYKAKPQIRGTNAHLSVDSHAYSTRVSDLCSLDVFSNELGVYGKIDLYKTDTHTLIERKYKLDTIYQGQVYQLHAQYFCMIEMGYVVDKIEFFSTSDHIIHPQTLPSDEDKKRLLAFINSIRNWDPTLPVSVSPNKCTHCIYSPLCEKSVQDHVYSS